MAIMNGMSFVRGRLGGTGFRQQYVSDGSNGYRKRTVAFLIPETNSSNTVRQQNQRSRFRLLAVLGGLLNRCGIINSFYYSGLGISGYNAFVRDNLTNEAVIQCDGANRIDWRKMIIALGARIKQILPFQSTLVAGTDYDESCQSAIKLKWSCAGICEKDEKDDWGLFLVGIKITEDGTAEDAITLQPGQTLGSCEADLVLPKCDCCKTYWFAFFVNPYIGENTTSVYLGADASTFADNPIYDEVTCCIPCECDDEETPAEACTMDEHPENCGCGHEDSEVDNADIVFTGERNFYTGRSSTRRVVTVLPPGIEEEDETEPQALDSDGDGLSDEDEINVHGTDPNNPDTDGGGVSDGDEVAASTNPNDAADDSPALLRCTYKSGNTPLVYNTTVNYSYNGLEIGGTQITAGPIQYSDGENGIPAAYVEIKASIISILEDQGYTVDTVGIIEGNTGSGTDMGVGITLINAESCPTITVLVKDSEEAALSFDLGITEEVM